MGIEVRAATAADAVAVTAIYNRGIAERQATFETRERRPEEIEQWLYEGRPFIVAADDASGAILGFARVSRVLDATRVCRGGGARRLRRSRGTRAWRGQATARRARAAGRGRRLLQADQPRLHHQRGEPRAAPRGGVHRGRRAAPPRLAWTANGRTRPWSNVSSERPCTDVGSLRGGGSGSGAPCCPVGAAPSGRRRLARRGRRGRCRARGDRHRLLRRRALHDDVRARPVRARDPRALAGDGGRGRARGRARGRERLLGQLRGQRGPPAARDDRAHRQRARRRRSVGVGPRGGGAAEDGGARGRRPADRGRDPGGRGARA